MKRIKSLLLSFVFPILAVAGATYVYAQTGEGKNTLCTGQYAICTSAPCIPVPGDPTKAICSCEVVEGKHLTTVPCDKTKPSTDEHGIKTVYSAFSQIQMGELKALKCPDGTPWTWCLNKRCTVDPSNPKKAICTCDVMRKGISATFGGKCDPATCKTAYWSAAPLADMDSGNKFLMKANGLDKSPIKWCPDGK